MKNTLDETIERGRRLAMVQGRMQMQTAILKKIEEVGVHHITYLALEDVLDWKYAENDENFENES